MPGMNQPLLTQLFFAELFQFLDVNSTVICALCTQKLYDHKTIAFSIF